MSTLIHVTNIEKSYGSRMIFSGADLFVREKQKIGVIGRNGAGKSTLFKLIIGQEKCDAGTIRVHANTRIGYLEQHDPFLMGETAIDFLSRYTGRTAWESAKVASRFQLYNKELESQALSLSGGYQMRVKLTAMLLKDPNILFLDEPTNFLDLSTLFLLEQFLKTYKGAYLIISHDREFLKRTCDETLDVEHGKLFLYPRPLEEYLLYKEEQSDMKLKFNKNLEKKIDHLQSFVDRFRAKASKASQAQSKLKLIDRMKPIQIEHSLKTVKIRLPKAEEKKGLLLEIKEVTMGYPDKIVADSVSFTIKKGEHIGIVGDNGQGKTTFLKTLVKEIPSLSGTLRFFSDINIGYYAQHIPQTLDTKLGVYEYLHKNAPYDVSREKILEMAGNFLFRDEDLEKKIEVLSGGEKARLCLAGILLQKKNCLFLDEPTTHLDFETVEALADALSEYNGTLLFVSHNRTFVHMVATGIIEVKNGRIHRYQGSYDEYVYQLEQKLISENEVYDRNHQSIEKKEKLYKNSYEEIKILKKRLKAVEKEMGKHTEEIQSLYAGFEERPAEYNKEKNIRLKELEKQLRELEREWLEIAGKLEGE